MAYIDGYLVPVPEGNREKYREMAQEMSGIFKEYGATRVVEAFEDDCPAGKRNDFHTAVLAEDGERTVFSFVEWPSKETRDQAWKKMEADERMQPKGDTPFDGKRLIYGGFTPIVDA
ncbi:DUF1428 domain-containing protein [Sphingomicrobium lutaoense]|uniref:Uncharacterized protein YbaA (DUF1428 family) n=1 Tax=Sphingomicrobium lutaoense TaxID=515949 RepID=A0A839Z4Q5_9SPHN|nr:DUF1428 domain-containing protein [Sphingomicrobium lutaoense]MBB3764592.1 uncharacterized protein YbaA (DUF1428 family) [Sphingomicrobium lutaoense]